MQNGPPARCILLQHPAERVRVRGGRYSVYSLYWYRSTNTDAAVAEGRKAPKRGLRARELMQQVLSFLALLVQGANTDVTAAEGRKAPSISFQFACFTGTNRKY